jgi:hypothetical protein
MIFKNCFTLLVGTRSIIPDPEAQPMQLNAPNRIQISALRNGWLSIRNLQMVHNETTDPKNPETLNPTGPQNST